MQTALSTFFESGGATLNSGAAPAADEEEDENEEMMAVPVPAPAAVAAVPRIPGGGNTLSGAAPSAMPAGWGSGSSSKYVHLPLQSSHSPRSAPPRAEPHRRTRCDRIRVPASRLCAISALRLQRRRRAVPDVRPTTTVTTRIASSSSSSLEARRGASTLPADSALIRSSGLSVENPNARRNAAGGMNDMIKGILQKAKESVLPRPSLGSADVCTAVERVSQVQPQLQVLRRRARSSRVLVSLPVVDSVVDALAANTLGSDDTPSVAIPDPTARSAVPGAFPSMAVEEEEDNEEPVIRNLIFWEDGFSIEDGELMAYDTPGNKEILAAINSGFVPHPFPRHLADRRNRRAPLSLLKVRHDQPVELRIAKRLSEKWSRQPSAPAGPFAGSGNRLGSEAAPGLNEVTPVPPPTTSRAPTTMSTSNVFEVDGTLPITTLQIRLRDGERSVIRTPLLEIVLILCVDSSRDSTTRTRLATFVAISMRSFLPLFEQC